MNEIVPGFRNVRGFVWPEADKECAAVVFGETAKLDLVMPLCRSKRSVVQAGGNCGVFPAYLAGHFGAVYTFEPVARNFVALTANTASLPNVVRFQAALGDRRCRVSMSDDPLNCGAAFVEPSATGIIPTMCIDDLRLDDCDLVYLDVEGYEMPALLGAAVTLRCSRPVVVIEDKGLSEKYGKKKGDVVQWLCEAHGYRVHARPQRDVVMVPGD